MAITVELLRPDDLVNLIIEGHNLRLDATNASAPVLTREDPEQEAFLVAVFPPQSFGEQVLREVDPPGKSDVAQVAGEYAARSSGPSRLAFRVPAGVVIPFSTAGLLDWTRLEPSLSPIAALRGQPGFLGGAGPAIVSPSPLQTAIELPYRLFISPGPDAQWRHRLTPARDAGRTVLWHTRLVATVEGEPSRELGAEQSSPIRAIYSPDYDSDDPPETKFDDFKMSLGPLARHSLVRLTSTFRRSLLGAGKDLGRPAEARRLALTSLGGFLDAEGRWPDPPPHSSLVGWSHVATLGRDAYVRVANRGRLLPLMNRATAVTITERRFEPSPDGSPVAYLRQYVRILLDEKTVTYGGLPFANEGRAMPLASVRVNVDQTPKIEIPGPGSKLEFIASGGVQTTSFEVKLGDTLWPFPCTAIDRAGNAIDFSIGMIFVPEEDIPAHVALVAAHYRALPDAARIAPANNARVKLADFGSASETTVFVASSFQFDVDLGAGPAGFLPKLSEIGVRVPSLELLTGSPKPTPIRFTASYLANGFDAAAGLFAEIPKNASLPVTFAADQAGGFVRPDLSVRGFSRELGPIGGDLSKVAAGQFDPGSAFGPLDAKLFGALPIEHILDGNALSGAPRITTAPDPDSPDHVVTKLTWETGTKAHDVGVVAFKPKGAATRLSITAAMRRALAGAEAPTNRVDGRLNDFSIELMQVVLIRFASFRFSSGSGKATEVAVDLADTDPIEFKGALDFVRKLSELIPPGIFGDSGPRITLKPDAIEVGLSLPLPPAALGVFSIRNISISTALTLPFASGRPSLAFAFATREKPFQLAVLILGGGGFVGIELDAAGVRCVEVMLEFGGVVALDVGVASGSVQILAGIYIALQGDATELTGYVRVSGEVQVLAIVSVSVEFMLSLTYYPAPRVAKGVASVKLSVRVAFISKSVSFSVERSFSAGSAHLSIGDAMSSDDWAQYAGAFA